MNEHKKNQWLIGKIATMPNDNPLKIVIVAVLLCLICSILVSTSAVILKPRQQVNKAADIKKNILAVTGLLTQEADMNGLFAQFDTKVVNLATGDYDDIDPDSYDVRKAVKDPDQSIVLEAKQDIANIGRRAKLAIVYILREGDTIKQVVLPIYGYGLWSTLYGFISLKGDLNTIQGLQFYDHAETPGLGGEVDNPQWRKRWSGKKVFDDAGKVKIAVIRGHVNPDVNGAEYQVDGLSGATLTSQGVSNLVKYWLGGHGFGPYLQKMRAKMEK